MSAEAMSARVIPTALGPVESTDAGSGPPILLHGTLGSWRHGYEGSQRI
jgi:hypothetical protein